MSTFCCFLLIVYPVCLRAESNIESKPDSLAQSHELNEVVISGVKGIGKDKIGQTTLSGAEINRLPVLFGEHDVIKALQTTSGVVSGTEGFAGLYVRGGETDQNLYILDGLPLLNVYHFGGLFSTFCTSSIDRVDFYKGAFPSSIAERASSIVDISLRKPDYNSSSGTFSIGLISGRAYFSTPLRKGHSALAMAFRRTWLDVISAPVLAIINASNKTDGKKSIFNYSFTDISVKLSATDSRRNELSFLLFYGKDNLKIGNERFDPQYREHSYHKDLNKMSWGNLGMAFSYRVSTPVGNILIQPFVSKAFSSDYQENINDDRNAGNMSTSSEVMPSVFQAGMSETYRFNIFDGLYAEVGLKQTWHDYDVGNTPTEYGDGELSDVRSTGGSHSANWLFSGYGEFHWNLANVLRGSAGLRATGYLSSGMRHFNPEPRLNVMFTMPSNSNISIAYSRLTQYAQQLSSNYIYLPSDAWLPTASHHKPVTCDIYTIGYYKKIRNNHIKAELWYKDMQNLAEYKPHTSTITTEVPWNDRLTFGKGQAYGLDLEIDGGYKSLDWSFSYGLMWNRRKFPDINSGERYPAKFDNRHKVDVSVGWRINERLELTGQWEYMTGNRTTMALYNVAPPDVAFPDAPFESPIDPDGEREDGLDYYDRRNNVRIPAFHRLNLNLSFKGRLNKRLTYQWDFGLYNAYCHMNPFAIVKSYVNEDWSNDGDYRKFKTLSLIPILPSVSYTINF